MLALGAVLLALVVTLLAAQYLKLQWSRSRYPPGPTPLPIIGNLWTLGFDLQQETLMQLGKTYGNVFTLWMGKTPLIVLNGCHTVRDALITHSEELYERPKAPLLEAFAKGKGIFTTPEQTWKQQKRLGMTILRNLGLGKRGLEERIQEEVIWLMEAFAMSKGKAMDPCVAITNSVTNVIALVVFGHRYSSDDKGFLQLTKVNTFLVAFLFTRWAHLFNAFPWLMQHLPGPQQDFLKQYVFLKNFVNKEIEIHKENWVPEEPQDFIDYYLDQISKVSDDVNSTYDEGNMNHTLIEIFVGATVPVSSTLRTALLHMATQPAIQEKVQEELDAAVRRSHVIRFEDRERLPYTNAVVHEVLRYGNGGVLFRKAVKQTSLQGFNVEKDTKVACNLFSLLNDSDYWEKPSQFNPGHFLDTEGKFVRNEAFMPFAAGHRACIGEQLSMTEVFIFFCSLLRAFTFRLPEGVKNVNSSHIERGKLIPQAYEICAVPRKSVSLP